MEDIDKITLVAVMRIEGKGTSEKDQYQLGGFCNDPGDIDVLSKAVTDHLAQGLASYSLRAQISLLPVLEINVMGTRSHSFIYILPMERCTVEWLQQRPNGWQS